MSDSNKIQRNGEEGIIIAGDTRKPVGYLNYSRAVATLDPLVPLGPNMLGEMLWPVTIQYLSHATRVGFSYISIDQARVAEFRTVEHLRDLSRKADIARSFDVGI